MNMKNVQSGHVWVTAHQTQLLCFSTVESHVEAVDLNHVIVESFQTVF